MLERILFLPRLFAHARFISVTRFVCLFSLCSVFQKVFWFKDVFLDWENIDISSYLFLYSNLVSVGNLQVS